MNVWFLEVSVFVSLCPSVFFHKVELNEVRIVPGLNLKFLSGLGTPDFMPAECRLLLIEDS